MSSKKDKEKELRESSQEEDDRAKSFANRSNNQRFDSREYREGIDRTLDQTKSSVSKSTNEAIKEIPEFTEAVNQYQQDTIQATKDIADNFLESQKEVIHTMQSAWGPYVETMQQWYFPDWMSPRNAAESYATAVSNLTDSAIAATRLANNVLFASMEAWKNTLQQTRDNALQLSNLNTNFARTFENTARNNFNKIRRETEQD